MYFDSLRIAKREQPELWKTFLKEVPTFSVAFFRHFLTLAGIFTHVRYYSVICRSTERYQTIWKREGERILSRLDEIFGFSLSGELTVYVCVTPIFLRNLEKSSFLLPTNAEQDRVLEIIVHELSHFYFFTPELSKRLSNEASWLLSEQVVLPLLRYHFSDICSCGESYVPVPDEARIAKIDRWLSGAVSFCEFLAQFAN